ncbi:hypothetical protein [Bradyrhizobium sp. 188]|uniref:hypothetical protein n=1 Tax=Bradyrhizobium sp. 188 TaxID=2782656 RepID=UPI001FFAFCC6|nr:hypothetical protein [Bradyrhizobium sp. 188]MCK1501485.1 hypothetical protein [Bradyrhizobium sp. 188]
MKLDVGVSVDSLTALGTVGTPTYDSDALAIFAAFTTPPVAARKTLINACVVSLKTAGVWSTLDALWVMAAADSQAARINWKNPATFTLSPVNSPTFTADRGYQGDGATSYLNTGFTPSTAGGSFSLNSAHLGVWSRTDLNSAAADMGAGAAGATSSMFVRNSGNLAGRSNDNSGSATMFATADSLGHFVLGRTDGTNRRGSKNGAAATTVAAASVTLTNAQITVAALGGASMSSRQYAEAHLGGGLSDANVAALYNALLTYNQAVGAA